MLNILLTKTKVKINHLTIPLLKIPIKKHLDRLDRGLNLKMMSQHR